MTEGPFLTAILSRDPRGSETIPSMGEIGLNHFAPYLMNRIMARWNADLAEELKAYDMTTARMRVLAVLCISSGMTVNELAVFTVTEQSTMSRTLDAMEEQGLIRRQPRPDDMRVREVHLTEAGRAAFETVWPMMYEHYVKMFEGVGTDEFQAFIATLHKILANIRRHGI